MAATRRLIALVPLAGMAALLALSGVLHSFCGPRAEKAGAMPLQKTQISFLMTQLALVKTLAVLARLAGLVALAVVGRQDIPAVAVMAGLILLLPQMEQAAVAVVAHTALTLTMSAVTAVGCICMAQDQMARLA